MILKYCTYVEKHLQEANKSLKMGLEAAKHEIS